MPTCYMQGCSCHGEPAISAEDQLDELKYWVQDISEKVDAFMENLELYDEIAPREEIAIFLKELRETLEKKKNEVMGYKGD